MGKALRRRFNHRSVIGWGSFFLLAASANLAPAALPIPIADDSLAELRAREEAVQQTLEKVAPAVVSISDGLGAGSGVIVNEEGLILTAGHVLLTDQSEIDVTLWDGRRVTAKPLGRNLNIDAGMVQIVDEGPFPFVEPAETESLEQGAWCIGLGHPGGYQLGRTPPVRLGRVIRKEDDVLVTDCVLIGGDSGGPLFDLKGRLIGIHSSIGVSLSQNRHVRVDGYYDHWDRLAGGEAWGRLGGVGEPDRDSAYLGVHLDLQGDEARVTRVLEGSAAESAGLQVGDVVLELDGNEIANSHDLIHQVGNKQAGSQFSVRVLRNGRRLTLRGTLGRYADSR